MSQSIPASTWAAFVQQFGDAITKAREERGWSQEQMIAITGLSRQTYQRVERGALPATNVANPTLRTILAIVCALEVELSDLIPPLDCEMILAETAGNGKRSIQLGGRGRPARRRIPDSEEVPADSVTRGSQAARSPLDRAVGDRSLPTNRSERGPWHERFGVRFPM